MKNDDKTWKEHMIHTYNHGEILIRFVLCIIILTGSTLKLFYHTYGMAGLPILLIKGTKSLEDESEEVSGNI